MERWVSRTVASRYAIRRLRTVHCKRGPATCAICREMNREAICLLDIDVPHPGEMQRRVLQVLVEGEPVWREYDVVREFENEQQARAYATENGIVDVRFE